VAVILALSITILCFCVYFYPTIWAKGKKHHNLGAIFALNLLLGWTFLGWVGALVWALTNQPKAAS
jgi:Superinfection immunity protein